MGKDIGDYHLAVDSHSGEGCRDGDNQTTELGDAERYADRMLAEDLESKHFGNALSIYTHREGSL